MIRYLQKLKHKKGFTLVEMMVVMAIIAFLSSILIPQLTYHVTLAQVTAANASASSIRKTIQSFMLDMSIQGKGMKLQGSDSAGHKLVISTQIIWEINNYSWVVKTECKPGYMNSSGWHDATAKNMGGSKPKTCYYDHTNWYDDAIGPEFRPLSDTSTINDPNHLIALSSSVRKLLPDLRMGIIIACFDAGLCKGVIYIPGWDHKWPESNYNFVPSTYLTGLRSAERPKLFWGRTGPERNEPYRLPEFRPWHGIWPKDVDDRVWKDGVAGVDVREGWIVGTSPIVTATNGRRAYLKDWEDPM